MSQTCALLRAEGCPRVPDWDTLARESSSCSPPPGPPSPSAVLVLAFGSARLAGWRVRSVRFGPLPAWALRALVPCAWPAVRSFPLSPHDVGVFPHLICLRSITADLQPNNG